MDYARRMTVNDIITRAGGPVRLANRLHGTPLERAASSIRKWVYNGIPRSHYDIVADLAGVTIADIHSANRKLSEARPSTGCALHAA